MDELYAVCAVNDVAKRQAVGYVLAKADENGAAVPFPVVVTRHKGKFYAYVNRCPHQGTRLDFQPGQFLDTGAGVFVCGKHGARFDIVTGHCVDGPCKGEALEKIDVVIDGGDVCLTGLSLAEEDGLDREEVDEMPQVMITSD